MSYYIAKNISTDIESAIERTRAALADQGFGVLMDLNIQETLKAKTATDVGGYRVLGACNPSFAREAIAAEAHIGTMLPCNILVRESAPGETEVAAVDPVASMQAVDNEKLRHLAAAVRDRLAASIEAL